MNLRRLTLLSLSLALGTELVYQAWRRWRSKPKAARKRRASVHEVICFRPHIDGGDGLKKSKYSRCLVTPQLHRVMAHLASARHTLDVAIYVVTSVDLANILTRLVRVGVTVRCLVDADMAYVSGAQVRRLERAGALVRWKKSPNLMHHKFCLIDANTDDENVTPLALTGSLNWTTQALNGNWENVLVTSQESLVKQLKAEFEELWTDFRAVELLVSQIPAAKRRSDV